MTLRERRRSHAHLTADVRHENRFVMEIPREIYPLSAITSEEEWRAIDVFRKRAKEFVAIRETQSAALIHGSMAKVGNAQFVGSSNIPRDEKLKEIYLAFRFFYLEKELSNFLRVRNILAKHSDSEEVSRYLRSLKDGWNRALAEMHASDFIGRKISGREYIDMWFNAHYFHSDIDEERKLEDVNAFLSEDVSRFHLYITILSSGACVGLLYLAISDLSVNSCVLSVPRFYMGKDA